MGSNPGAKKTQFIAAPAKIAPIVSANIGKDISLSASKTGWRGCVFVGDHKAEMDKRVE